VEHRVGEEGASAPAASTLSGVAGGDGPEATASTSAEVAACAASAAASNTGQGGGGGGGSSFFTNTVFHDSASGQTQTTSLLPAAAGRNTDDQYVAGVGVGSSGHEAENAGDGGNGEIVIQYTTDTPTTTNLISSGIGTAVQQITATVPDNGSATLLVDGDPTTTIEVPSQGTYAVDPQSGALSFTPVLGYTGTANAVSYRVATQGGNVSEPSTYTATVTAPAAPTANPLSSFGTGTDVQSTPVDLPEGGHVTLTGPTSNDDGNYAISDDGTALTFTPFLGFQGYATPVTYQVTDAYNQSDSSAYFPFALGRRIDHNLTDHG
jgi:CshA-type fibril repeat protein